MKIGIVGNGYVGQSTSLSIKDGVCKLDSLTYDKDPQKCNPIGLQPRDLTSCDFVFICVPTPMEKDGSCHLDIVKSVVSELTSLGMHKRRIVVRSTVPAGTCESLGVSFMPEFITESNWKEDALSNGDWIFGYDPPAWINWTPEDRMAADFLTLGKYASKKVTILTTKEAELVKLTRNAFLATKVSFFNEIEHFCRSTGVSYDNVRKGVCMDNRINDSHTHVPGPDGKRGFGGTCFPKDTFSLYHQISDQGAEPYILNAVLTRNQEIDRPEEDWKNNKGRSVV